MLLKKEHLRIITTTLHPKQRCRRGSKPQEKVVIMTTPCQEKAPRICKEGGNKERPVQGSILQMYAAVGK